MSKTTRLPVPLASGSARLVVSCWVDVLVGRGMAIGVGALVDSGSVDGSGDRVASGMLRPVSATWSPPDRPSDWTPDLPASAAAGASLGTTPIPPSRATNVTTNADPAAPIRG
jgi:hypothetical protein